MRGLILAFQFLIRRPTPQRADFKQEELSTSAIWFPLVGLVIGLLLVIATLLLWHTFLQWRLGGMSGDCLGAGIEYCECAMLLAACLL